MNHSAGRGGPGGTALLLRSRCELRPMHDRLLCPWARLSLQLLRNARAGGNCSLDRYSMDSMVRLPVRSRRSLSSRAGSPGGPRRRWSLPNSKRDTPPRETGADSSAIVLAEPSADLRFDLGRQGAKIRLRQQLQYLNGQGKCLVIPVQARETLLGGQVCEALLRSIVR